MKQVEEKNEMRAQMEAQVKERRLAIHKGEAPRKSISGPTGAAATSGVPKVSMLIACISCHHVHPNCSIDCWHHQ